MHQQQQMQQACQQRNQGAGDAFLDNVWAAIINVDSPALQKIRGYILSVTSLGSGAWEIVLSQALPLGEYLSGTANLTGALGFSANMTDGNATIKFVDWDLLGTPAEPNGWSAWWARSFNS